MSHRVLYLIPCLLLAVALVLPAAAVGQVSPDMHLGTDLEISALDNEQLLPAVAYNSQRQEFLVVWQNNWAGNRDIYAQRVSATGALLSWFAVTAGANDRAQPAVAYDPVNDRYLVVWIYDDLGNGADWDVYGRFIPALGPDPGLGEFVICNWATSQWNPAVAYARSQGEFMVVWANNQSAGVPWYVSGRRIDATTGAFPSGGADVTIAHATEDRINPDVAYNLARNEYLVVWEQVAGSQDIWALRMTGTAAPLGGGAFAIAGWADWEGVPAVAACGQQDQYLVAWQSDVGTGGTDYDIYAWFLGGDGATQGAPLLVSNTSLPETDVDIGCDWGERQYLLTWQSRFPTLRDGIAARLAMPGRTLEAIVELAEPGSAADRTRPAVAGGHTTFLVAWEHDREGTAFQDIHGRLMTPHMLFLPMVAD